MGVNYIHDQPWDMSVGHTGVLLRRSHEACSCHLTQMWVAKSGYGEQRRTTMFYQNLPRDLLFQIYDQRSEDEMGADWFTTTYCISQCRFFVLCHGKYINSKYTVIPWAGQSGDETQDVTHTLLRYPSTMSSDTSYWAPKTNYHPGRLGIRGRKGILRPRGCGR